MTDKEIINQLDGLNTIRWKSLEGTPEELRRCGLLVPIDQWQSLREEILND
jgi:hypothetical protein